MSAGVLRLVDNGEGCDYTLAPGCSCWIEAGNVLLYIIADDNGSCTVEALPADDDDMIAGGGCLDSMSIGDGSGPDSEQNDYRNRRG